MSVGVAHIQRAVVILLNCNILYQCVFVVSFLKKKCGGSSLLLI